MLSSSENRLSSGLEIKQLGRGASAVEGVLGVWIGYTGRTGSFNFVGIILAETKAIKISTPNTT